jgi:hypothetical protein
MKKIFFAVLIGMYVLSGCFNPLSGSEVESTEEIDVSSSIEEPLDDGMMVPDDRSSELLTNDDIRSGMQLQADGGELRVRYPQYDNRDAPEFIGKLNEYFYEKAFSPLEKEEVYPTVYECGYEITYNTPTLVSVRYEYYLYSSPAANGVSACEGITANLSTDEILDFHSFFIPGPMLYEYIKNLMRTYLFEEGIELFDSTQFEGIDDEQRFYLTDSAFVVVYQPCRYTPHCFGILEIPIYFEEVKQYLASGYRELLLPFSLPTPETEL